MSPVASDCSDAESGPEAVPLQTVFLHVTKACNLHCSYCYFSAHKPLPDEMTAGEFRRFWPQLVALRPRKIVFTGGEPLLRPDLLELLGDLRNADPEHRVLRCLNSNGHRVTPELARRLVGLADEVRVSIDALRERNDAHRGKGNFDAALRALDCYSAAGFEPVALITVTPLTLPDLEELVCLLIGRGITRFNVNGFRPIGRGAAHPEWRPDAAVVRAALRRAWERCHPDRPAHEPTRPAAQSHCGVGQMLNVLPNGDVFPCHALTDPAFRCGNVREERLLDICRRDGLLGALQSLDFRALSARDASLAALTRPGTCMGEVYHATPDSPTWRVSLPLVSAG
jgi:MoaA/NifB/PqqE/SkfB family radical SAM enzyme